MCVGISYEMYEATQKQLREIDRLADEAEAAKSIDHLDFTPAPEPDRELVLV